MSKRKNNFEIKAFSDGWDLLSHHKNKDWVMCAEPISFPHPSDLVVNDTYVEYRKAQKEGFVIEINKPSGGWVEVDMNDIQPTNEKLFIFRIKAQKFMVDFTEDNISTLYNVSEILDYENHETYKTNLVNLIEKIELKLENNDNNRS